MDNTEAELESFRQQWRREVSARNQAQNDGTPSLQPGASSSTHRPMPRRSAAPAVPSSVRGAGDAEHDLLEPTEYHDLGEKELGRRLDDHHEPSSPQEPRSALEHYEKAVEQETKGKLGDSMHLYRRAFKLDADVQEHYKNKHHPPGSYVPPKVPPVPSSSAAAPTPAPAPAPASAPTPSSAATAIETLISEFADLSIPGLPPPSDLSPAPPCPIAGIPHEIMAEILLQVALTDLASLGRLAQVCKRFAYLVATEDRVWRRIVCGPEFGFAAQTFRFTCTVEGQPLDEDTMSGRTLAAASPVPEDSDAVEAGGEAPVPEPRIVHLPLDNTYTSYRQMFQTRPRIRFNGCYISTVNYFRAGAASQTTWMNPCIIVTYYRYLRFFRDGTAISLLTTTEPGHVVPYLHKENMHEYASGSTLPNAVMKDALAGRWRISGPEPTQVWPPPRPRILYDEDGEPIDIPDEIDPELDDEPEGTLHVETEGVTPKYIWKMAFALLSAGRKSGVRNNKLGWRGFWSYNKLTDDWGEFRLKNDGPFYWSRVRSWI